MKFCFALILALTLLTPSALHAEDELNAGFVKGLWYSSPTVFANEPVRIYVALRNHTDRDLTGTVRFSANGKRIGIAYVSALPGRIVEAWTDWTPSFGEYTITASLTEVRFHELGENPKTAEVISMLAEDKLFADYDTDKDGLGNKEDADDDGDGISDDDELLNGTNPLVPDSKEVVKKNASEADEIEPNASTPSERTSQTSAPPQSLSPTGLERFTPEGPIDNVITTVTERINATRDSLDTYRTTKLPITIPFLNDHDPANTPTPSTLNSSTSSPSPQSTATITRSKIESDSDGFLAKAWSLIKNVALGIFALLLWLISTLFAHPALVQILFLIFIVYLLYRTARKFGRRPND